MNIHKIILRTRLKNTHFFFFEIPQTGECKRFYFKLLFYFNFYFQKSMNVLRRASITAPPTLLVPTNLVHSNVLVIQGLQATGQTVLVRESNILKQHSTRSLKVVQHTYCRIRISFFFSLTKILLIYSFQTSMNVLRRASNTAPPTLLVPTNLVHSDVLVRQGLQATALIVMVSK